MKVFELQQCTFFRTADDQGEYETWGFFRTREEAEKYKSPQVFGNHGYLRRILEHEAEPDGGCRAILRTSVLLKRVALS